MKAYDAAYNVGSSIHSAKDFAAKHAAQGAKHVAHGAKAVGSTLGDIASGFWTGLRGVKTIAPAKKLK